MFRYVKISSNERKTWRKGKKKILTTPNTKRFSHLQLLPFFIVTLPGRICLRFFGCISKLFLFAIFPLYVSSCVRLTHKWSELLYILYVDRQRLFFFCCWLTTTDHDTSSWTSQCFHSFCEWASKGWFLLFTDYERLTGECINKVCSFWFLTWWLKIWSFHNSREPRSLWYLNYVSSQSS